MTRVAVLGLGPVAAQIGSEYALGGCVVLWAQDGEGAQQRVEEALRLASTSGLAGPAELERARSLMVRGDATISSAERITLIVDASGEDAAGAVQLEARAEAISRIAERHPEALVASTSPVPSVTALGEAAGVGERMMATRYGDPPLLCPVVELLAARDTPHRLLERVSQLLRALGKHPLVLRREVPGLASGRLELAVLREALWLIERGVVEPEALDELVRDSLARSWALIGPLASAALAAPNGLRELAGAVVSEQPPGDAESLASLAAETEPDRLAALRERRDEGLAAALRAERGGGSRAAENGD